MKRLLIIIAILLVIFVGMIINRKTQIQNKTITVGEVQKIETYLQKIYMWKEVTGQAIPTFQNIEEADEIWIWEVIKKNLEEYESTNEQIQEKGKEIFGQDFTKNIKKEENESFIYNEQTGKYDSTGTIIDEQNDCFILDTIEKTEQGYEVEIIEYIENYSQLEETEEGMVEIENIKAEIIATIENNDVKTKAIEIVKEYKEKFTKKKIYLENKEEQIYVKKVEDK